MAERGMDKIRLLQRRYIGYQVLADLFFSSGLAILIVCFGYSAFSLSWWWAALYFGIFFGCMTALRKWWRVDIKRITSYLNCKYPDLEESSELVFKQPEELNTLERLQLSKIEAVLEDVPAVQMQFMQRLRFSILFFLSIPLFGWEVTQMRGHWNESLKQASAINVPNNASPEKILPGINSVSVTIVPPGYTARLSRNQDKFTIEAEQGSLIKWELGLNVAAKQVALLFNNGQRIILKNTNTTYLCQKIINMPGFYQVSINGKLSDLYPVQIIKDKPPVIHIRAPQQYTYIDAGEAPRVNISASVDDDYGISNAFIYATVAKGSGESVKFKEQKIDFPASFSDQHQHYDLQKLVNLPSLNIEPGDELYFYVQAQDNHKQQSRTEVYIVSLQDTAQLLSMDGLIGGVNVKPEFFRSERQIIIDSERLLRDRDSLSKESFHTRSNDLGTDQKLLRLRYGKFLGEESESDINPKENENDAVADPNNYGNAAVVLDKYSDKHDNAEDAQFFDPGIKAQLKATLTEMWKAELQLRLYKPEAALPFEYKALRLLKDLQQKSRMFVAKTAYNPAPLKMEKRLTGQLDKIIQPVGHRDIKPEDNQFEVLKEAAEILEKLKAGTPINHTDRHTLELSTQQLSEIASAQPEIYLPALGALHRILSASGTKRNDISVVEKAIQRILPPGKTLPYSMQNSSDMGLSSGYYKNLNNK